jgi:hypothetical protein
LYQTLQAPIFVDQDNLLSDSRGPLMANSPTSFMGQISHSPKSRGSCQRPRLMRSSATAPCVATSNASRNDLASLHPTSRASTLLSRVASYSQGRRDSELRVPSDRRQSASPQQRSRSPHNHDETLDREKDDLYVDRISQGPSLLSSQ